MSCIAPRCQAAREPGSLFCRPHELAPAAQRGGWLSAEKRRRAMGASKEIALDASNIVKRLWVGSVPPFDRDLPDFDTLVLCARELQPERIVFGRQVIRVPIPDNALTSDELRRALAGGRQVAASLAAGKRVLVTCHAGLNRSALVASIGLGMVTRMQPAEIIDLMRARRSPEALGNRFFCDYIMRFIGAARKPRPTPLDR